jgi:hypothetical protein
MSMSIQWIGLVWAAIAAPRGAMLFSDAQATTQAWQRKQRSKSMAMPNRRAAPGGTAFSSDARAPFPSAMPAPEVASKAKARRREEDVRLLMTPS